MKAKGVGTAVSEILESLGIREYSGCSCAKLVEEWNANGVEWCRTHISEMADILHQNMEKHPSALAKLTAGAQRIPLVGGAVHSITRYALRYIVERAVRHVQNR
jgi:hypothetical protein